MHINWKLVVIIAVAFLLYFFIMTSWQAKKTIKLNTSMMGQAQSFSQLQDLANIKHKLGMDDVTRSRTLVSVSDIEDNSFSVVSYNILADCYIQPALYPDMPPGCRTSEERHPRLLAELLALDGDIVQLQEVEEHYLVNTLGLAMQKLGYTVNFKLKTSGCEGLATFYKMDKFELIDKEALTINEMMAEAMKAAGYGAFIGKPHKQSEVFLMLKLRHNATGNIITVGNIHTIWANFQALAISTLQLSLAMQRVVNASGGKRHIISGDMNNKPGMAPYRFLETGNLTEDIKSQLAVENSEYLDGKPIWQTLQGLYRHNSFSLASSYKTAIGKEPDFTNYVNSFHMDYADCLDYIWYSENSLKVHNVLSPVTEKDIEGAPEKRLPNCLFPSDHLSLKTVFSFK